MLDSDDQPGPPSFEFIEHGRLSPGRRMPLNDPIPLVGAPRTAQHIVSSAADALAAQGLTVATASGLCGMDIAVLHYPAADVLGAYTFVLQGGRWTTTRCMPTDNPGPADPAGTYVGVSSPLDGMTNFNTPDEIVDTIVRFVTPPEIVPTHPRQELPYRVVDDLGQGWRAAFPADRDTFPLYLPAFGHQRDLEPLCHHELAGKRGPLRVVIHDLEQSAVDLMGDLLLQCDDNAVTTLCEAVRHAFEQTAKGVHSGPRRAPAPVSIMISSDETDPDTKLLRMLGNYADSHFDRTPERVHAMNAELLSGMLGASVTHHDEHVLHVAGFLPVMFGQFADHIAAQVPDITPSALWRMVAHRYLQPGTGGHNMAAMIYKYLMRGSRHYDPSIWD